MKEDKSRPTTSFRWVVPAGIFLGLHLVSAGWCVAATHLRPVIEYRFDNLEAFESGVVENRGRNQYDATIAGDVALIDGVLGNALLFDDSTGYIQVRGGGTLDFSRGLTIEAFVQRASNLTEDAVVSKWYGADQFLLTFYPIGNGRIYFSVYLEDDSEEVVVYDLPDTGYLQDWVHVSASFGPGRMSLIWNGRLVASKKIAAGKRIRGSSLPIRIGDAGFGTPWSRFDGSIDEVKIWRRSFLTPLAIKELIAFGPRRVLSPRVLVLEFDSVDPTYNDPVEISNNLISNIGEASRYVEFEIVDWLTVGTLPPQRVGGGFDYEGLFQDYDICRQASRGDIHEVWIWAGPDGGLLEYAVNGPWWEAFGLGVGMPACDIQMVVMGLNYERQLPEATHSFGHRLETIFQHHWGDDWDAFDGQDYRYAYANEDQPPLVTVGTHCGNVHFPPNADQHSEWDSLDPVDSNCGDWHSDEGGTYVELDCWNWGCTQLGFLNWWMSHMPGRENTNGPEGASLPNWWTKVVE